MTALKIEEYVGKFPAHELIQNTQVDTQYPMPKTWGIFENVGEALEMFYSWVNHYPSVNIDITKDEVTGDRMVILTTECQSYDTDETVVDIETYTIKVHHAED